MYYLQMDQQTEKTLKNTVTFMNKVLRSPQLMKCQMKLVLHSLHSQTELLRVYILKNQFDKLAET